MSKKIVALLLAALVSAGCSTAAFAENEQIQSTIELNQYMFAEKVSVSGRFLNMVKSHPGESATLKTPDYAYTFYSDSIGDIDDHRTYSLRVKKISGAWDLNERFDNENPNIIYRDISIFNTAVGTSTPKYIFETEAETLPAPMDFTILESNFMPGGLVNIYRLEESSTTDGVRTSRFSVVEKQVKVADNGDITVPLETGGTYLVTTGTITDHTGDADAAAFDFDRP